MGIIAPFDCLLINSRNRVGMDRTEASVPRLVRLESVSRRERDDGDGIGAIATQSSLESNSSHFDLKDGSTGFCLLFAYKMWSLIDDVYLGPSLKQADCRGSRYDNNGFSYSKSGISIDCDEMCLYRIEC